MNIAFELEPLDHFHHELGLSCAEKSLLFAIWKLPVTNLYDKEVESTIYIYEGGGALLLGYNIIHK